MSILIKGMEMPQGCGDCPCLGGEYHESYDNHFYCQVTDKGIGEHKPDWCPLIEVPEDVQPVTHCKDCVYRPYYEPSDSKSASDLVFPDYRFNLCPCRVEDFWYSWMPDDDWFCAYGKQKDGET